MPLDSGLASIVTDCYFNLGQMHQLGYGVDKDTRTSVRYYKKACSTGNHAQAYTKCGDYYYSQRDKRSAMACYKKAADFGDVMALNNIGLMLEQGYEDIAPQAEEALKMYKQAHNLGSLDATLNLAIFYLSGKLVPIDQKVGKALLLKAHSQKSARAGEIML